MIIGLVIVEALIGEISFRCIHWLLSWLWSILGVHCFIICIYTHTPHETPTMCNKLKIYWIIWFSFELMLCFKTCLFSFSQSNDSNNIQHSLVYMVNCLCGFVWIDMISKILAFCLRQPFDTATLKSKFTIRRWIIYITSITPKLLFIFYYSHILNASVALIIHQYIVDVYISTSMRWCYLSRLNHFTDDVVDGDETFSLQLCSAKKGWNIIYI